MIQKIALLSDFGIYRNFQGNGLPPFAKFNLIYGWNYSGKTTLSRLFKILEEPGRASHWPTSSFEILLNDGSCVTQSSLSTITPPLTRVFNREFVVSNFAQEHTAPEVFILGEGNVKLRQQLKRLNRHQEQVLKLKAKFESRVRQSEQEINTLGTDKARDAGNMLGDRNFRRPDLIRRVNEVRKDFNTSILCDADVTAKLQIHRTTSAWTVLNPIQTAFPDLVARAASIAALLGRTASNRAIERLKSDPNLENWVRSGLTVHQDKQVCEFCGSPISEGRLELLKRHFSEEYETLVRALKKKITDSKNLRLSVPLPDERDFAPDLKTDFTELRGLVLDWEAWAAQLQKREVDALNQKLTQIEAELTWEPDLSRAGAVNSLYQQINDLIQRHNNAANNLARSKTDAKVALEKHFAALLLRDSDLSGKESRIAAARSRVNDAAELLRRIGTQIATVEIQVSQQSIAATRLNELLRFLLAGNNIEVTSAGDGLFKFSRDGVAATNLSDGEKTAISFAYFLISLEGNGSVLADTIVFIDDPISSLDSNHIYAVYALLVENLAGCRQLFLSTHNSELFNLLKDHWFKARKQYANTQDASAYYVNRTLDGNARWMAALEDLPVLLRKYKSEYHFVFSQLHTFANAQAPSLHEAYTAPNLLRKFLEAYLGFRKPCVSKWSNKLDLLFETREEQREIQKFADDASHLQGVSRALQQPNFITSAQSCVGKVIAGLKARDFDHYCSLCKVADVEQ